MRRSRAALNRAAEREASATRKGKAKSKNGNRYLAAITGETAVAGRQDPTSRPEGMMPGSS